ncbi:MAG: LacI family DNA-binding transcriptional regulator [Catenulispora sp.]|nr:LacI family DNA-binding transcriptional regulator [Catenulispora sp.]
MGSTVSIRHVAEAAGVSVGTVSNVLNHPERVAAATRERVARVIEHLGFVRNESARQLRGGTARAIGLIVPDIGNPFFTDVARGVEAAASAVGQAVVLCNSDGSRRRERRNTDLLAEQRVHGVLITPVGRAHEPVRRLREHGLSVVLVDHPTADPLQCSVSVDDRTGGELAVTHLLAAGSSSIVYVGGPAGGHQVAERRRGAFDAVRKAGRDESMLEVFEQPALTVVSGMRAGERLLARRTLPDAVFCANDLLALGLLQSMVRAGVVVPDDLAIVGYDDIDFAAAAAVPLSSVRQPREQLGRTAAELVISESFHQDAHEHPHVLISPELVVRESSRPRRAPGATRRQSVDIWPGT